MASHKYKATAKISCQNQSKNHSDRQWSNRMIGRFSKKAKKACIACFPFSLLKLKGFYAPSLQRKIPISPQRGTIQEVFYNRLQMPWFRLKPVKQLYQPQNQFPIIRNILESNRTADNPKCYNWDAVGLNLTWTQLKLNWFAHVPSSPLNCFIFK